MVPKSPSVRKGSISKRKNSGYKYGTSQERSTKKKQRNYYDEHENGNYIQEDVKFSNSSCKFSQIDETWKERTLKRSRLFMDSQQSISSINTNANNLTNLSSMAMMHLCMDRGPDTETTHNSYVKYKSSSTNNSSPEKVVPLKDQFSKRSPRLHEIRKI
jgi:hypothetical protein